MAGRIAGAVGVVVRERSDLKRMGETYFPGGKLDSLSFVACKERKIIWP